MATISHIGVPTPGATVSRPIHDGGDVAVVAQANINQTRTRWRWLTAGFTFKIFLALLAATVDIAVMKGLLSARFSDEFGIVEDGKQTWIWLSSVVTVLYFFVIGRCFIGGVLRKGIATLMYMALLCFMAVSLHSSYLSDFTQIFGSFATGWGNTVAGVVVSQTLWIKAGFMLVISIVLTGPGLLFAWAERRVELTYCELEINSRQLHESVSIVNLYNAAKAASDAQADAEEARQKAHAFFSDPANTKAVALSMQAEAVKAYVDQLNSLLRAVPPNTLQTPRAEQAANDARRIELTDLIADAKTLKFN